MHNSFIHFALPDIDNLEFEQIKEALLSGWITTGPKTRKFETEFASMVNAKHAIAVNSCTAAMHLALEAISLKEGDEVITSPYTFAATSEVIRYFDAKPVFVDVDSDSLNIRPDLIEQAITKRTKAIMPVHIAGLPADMDVIRKVAKSYKLAIIEDAAHAFPSKYKDKMIGEACYNPNSPNIVCFSFYATKTLTTGEGGMICTQDDDLAERSRVMALHGISKDAWKRYTAEGSWYYEIVSPGYKYNMTDIAAGMGLAQLAKAERMWLRRKEIAERYNMGFEEIPQLQIPFDRNDCQHAWHLYMLRLNLDRLRIDRAQFIDELKRRNIGSSVHFIPLHTHPYYMKQYGYKADDFPTAYREYMREISLPIYSKMTDQDVNCVIDSVKGIARQNQR